MNFGGLLANSRLFSLKKFILETNLSMRNHPMIYFGNKMHPSEYEIAKHVPIQINWEFLRYYWNTYKIVAVKFRKSNFNISLLKVVFTSSLRKKNALILQRKSTGNFCVSFYFFPP